MFGISSRQEFLQEDPDMILEADIPLLRNTRPVAGSPVLRRNDSPFFNYGGKRSRARPLKPHEHMPFLSLDVAPEFRDQMRARARTDIDLSGRHRDAKKKTVKSSKQFSSRPGSRQMSALLRPQSRSGTPSLKYVSPNARQKRMNHNLKTPFKHNTNKPDSLELRPPSPSEDLKERTALATFHVSRLISQQPQSARQSHTGRLLKGRLKPLKPVVNVGPSIQLCLGVNPKPPMSPTPYYRYTLERTQQKVREKAEIDQLNLESLRPKSGEMSLHQTSAASSVCDDENMSPFNPSVDTAVNNPQNNLNNAESPPDIVQVQSEGQRSSDTQARDNEERWLSDDEDELKDDFEMKITVSAGDYEKTSSIRGLTPKHSRISEISRGSRPESRRSSAKSVRFADSPDISAGTGQLASAEVKSKNENRPSSSPSILKKPTAKESEPSTNDVDTEAPAECEKLGEAELGKDCAVIGQSAQDGDSGTKGSVVDPDKDSANLSEDVAKADSLIWMESRSDEPGDRFVRSSARGPIDVVLHNSTPAIEHADDGSHFDNSNHDNQLIADDAHLLQAEVSSVATTVWSDSRDASNENSNYGDNGYSAPPGDNGDEDMGVGAETGEGVDTAGSVDPLSCQEEADAVSHKPRLRDDDEDDDNQGGGNAGCDVTKPSGSSTVLLRKPQSGQSSKGSTSGKGGSQSGGRQRGGTQDRDRKPKSSKNNKTPPKKGKLPGNSYSKRHPEMRASGRNNDGVSVENCGVLEAKVIHDAWIDPLENVAIDNTYVPSTFEELNAELTNMRVEIKRWISLDQLADTSCGSPLKSPRSMDSLLDPCSRVCLTDDGIKGADLRLDISDDEDDDLLRTLHDYSSDSEIIMAPRKLDLGLTQIGDKDLMLSLMKKICLASVCGEFSSSLTTGAHSFGHARNLKMDSHQTVIGKLTQENLMAHSCFDSSVTTSSNSYSERPDCDGCTKHETVSSMKSSNVQNYDLVYNESDSGLGSESKTVSDVTDTDSVVTDSTSIISDASTVVKDTSVVTNATAVVADSTSIVVTDSTALDHDAPNLIADSTYEGSGDCDDPHFLELVCDELPEPKQKSPGPDKLLQPSSADNLTVVATSKTISRPKTAPKETPPIAPYPPLCFHINARPPEGQLYYFAYGTDMNPNRIGTYIKRSVESRLWGLLFGFQLVFNKKGVDVDAGGFPNIEFNPYASVEGCLYTITPAELEKLDSCVGYPEHFEHVMLPVWMVNCHDPSNYGVAQHCVPALTYIAQDKWVEKSDGSLLHHEYSLNQCLKNADLLTPMYQRHLLKMSQGER